MGPFLSGHINEDTVGLSLLSITAGEMGTGCEESERHRSSLIPPPRINVILSKGYPDLPRMLDQVTEAQGGLE